jgi:hypothetical protein
LVDLILEKFPINHPGIFDPGLLNSTRVLTDNLLRFILPLTELIKNSDIVFFESRINRLSYSGVASDKLLEQFSILFGLLAISLVVVAHCPEELILLLLN